MTTPLRIAQTSKEAQKAYKKNGSRLPERELRRLEREVELESRAARFRDKEKRERAAKQKRIEKERKDRDARKQLGISLASQLVGFSHTQAKMKNGMETFLRLKKKEVDDKKNKELEEMKLKRKLESIAQDMEKEPWDDSDGEDAMADLSAMGATVPHNNDHWADDGLDDDSLLEAHDLVTLDIIDDRKDPISQSPPFPPLLPVSVLEPRECETGNADAEFIRLHGPINKAIEETLSLLPEPLIELLSQDTSTNLAFWNPAPSLLHKLNPVGLPPHRLRLKAGCTVSLLRDLNTSSQLSKSCLLRVLRIETEWLECLVLDGQLEGTKTFITRVTFPAKYRNEEQFGFSRVQFPIRVSTKHVRASTPKSLLPSPSMFKIPSMKGQPKRSQGTFKRPAIPKQRARSTSNSSPSFKPLELPALKNSGPVATRQPNRCVISVTDCWDDFLVSGTQIARELSSDYMSPTTQPKVVPVDTLVPLSSQDLDFEMGDLEDDIQSTHPPQKTSPQTMHSRNPLSCKSLVDVPSTSRLQLSHHPSPLRKSIDSTKSVVPAKSLIGSLSRPPQPTTRKASPTPLSTTSFPPKKVSIQPLTKNLPAKTVPTPKVNPVPKAVSAPRVVGSFSDFGLSTQEVVSFFDDDEGDEMVFGTPQIAV